MPSAPRTPSSRVQLPSVPITPVELVFTDPGPITLPTVPTGVVEAPRVPYGPIDSSVMPPVKWTALFGGEGDLTILARHKILAAFSADGHLGVEPRVKLLPVFSAEGETGATVSVFAGFHAAASAAYEIRYATRPAASATGTLATAIRPVLSGNLSAEGTLTLSVRLRKYVTVPAATTGTLSVAARALVKVTISLARTSIPPNSGVYYDNSRITLNWTGSMVTNTTTTTDGSYRSFWYSNQTLRQDQYAQVTLAGAEDNARRFSGVTIRGTASATCVAAYVSGNTFYITDYLNGVAVGQRATATVSSAAGGVIRLEAVGNTYKGFYNGVQVATWVDSGNLTIGPDNTRCGFILMSNRAYFTNYNPAGLTNFVMGELN